MNATETRSRASTAGARLSAAAVRTSVPEIVRFLRDNSWLSPVLAQALERRNESDGSVLGVQAVVTPATEADVISLAAIAARHRLPLTPRGAGTSNFGLLTPAEGGVIVDPAARYRRPRRSR